MHGPSFVMDLAIVLGVAAVTGVVFRRLRQPSVVGYLLSGLIVGPYLPLPLFADPQRVQALSEFGVVLVMFAIGLEFRLARLMRVLPVSGVTGLIQMGALAWLGFVAGGAFGWNTVQSLFLGASIAISSTMVVSKVFDERQVPGDVRELVLGVLVLQDVAAIALIATMTAVASGGALSPGELATMLWRLLIVLVSLVVGGLFVVPRAMHLLVSLGSQEALVVGATALCFVMAVIAEWFGYSVALGAFIAGILVAESGRGAQTELAIGPLKDVFAAVFFVSIGMNIDPRLALENIGPVALVSALVIVGQLSSVTVGGLLSGNGLRRSVGAGLALGQIGEFAFIISAIGIEARVAPAALSPILVSVAVVTAFVTPHAIAAAPRVVHVVDHVLPSRLQNALVVYESWFERIRAAKASEGEQSRSPRRRATRAVVLDGLGLFVLAIAWGTQADDLAAMLSARFDLSLKDAMRIATAAALLIGSPLLWILFVNTDRLARLAAESAFGNQSEDAARERPAAEALLLGAFRAMALLGVGVPSAALLRPLFGAPYVALGLGLLLAFVAVGVWRNASRLDRDVRSAAEAMAEVVARQTAEAEPHHEPHAQPVVLPRSTLPGVDNMRRLTLATGMAAVGESLSSLDLRARTGAAVLAIHRAGHDVVVPTGSETLDDGDVLVLAGTQDALAQACALLGRDAAAVAEPA